MGLGEYQPRRQAARIEAEATVSMLRRLEMVTDTALSGVTLEALLDALTERLRLALESDTATILLLEAGGRHLVQYVSHGLREEVDEPVRIPVGAGVAFAFTMSAASHAS